MKTGRPKQFDPDRALLAATELFWRKGFEATSTADLMSAMKLSKSSLYQSFGSKQQLFSQCIERYGSNNTEGLLALLADAKSAKQFLWDFFRHTTDPALNPDAHKGCLLVNSACEFGETDAAMRALVSKKLEQFRIVIERAVVRAQEQGEITSGRDASELAAYLVSSLCGLRVMARGNKNPSALTKTIELIFSALE